MDTILELSGLTKAYDGFRLDDLNLSIAPGTITGLVGANGAGKSTTIKLILNLIRRDAGTIRVFGLDNIQNEREIKEKIGVVFDEPCFHETLAPRHIDGYMRGVYAGWDSARFRQFLRDFGLPENKAVKEFSRGMKMKLSIAAAMSHGASLLILDEPTSGLDPLVRDEILDIFLDFLQDESHAILLSSHITSDLDKIADTIALLHGGRLLFHEEKDALREDYAVVKGGRDQLRTLEEGELIGLQTNEFGFEALCRRETARRHPELVAERPTIEEIMLFYTRKKKGGR